MSSTSAVSVLAQGLRELRDFAEGPDGEELRQRTGLTAEQIDTALAGDRLPTREVTLALVEAWGGDVEAWREYWGQIAALAEEDESEGATATPAPPEPSIITPMVADEAEAEAAAEPDEAQGEKPEQAKPKQAKAKRAKAEQAEPERAKAQEPEQEQEQEQAEAQAEQETDDAEAEVMRARSAARARLEANAQAAKAQSEAMAAAAEAEAQDTEEPTEAEPAEQHAAPRVQPGSGSPELKPVILARAEAAPEDDAPEDDAPEEASEQASEPKPAKRGLLARVGIPILVFAIGVGVGAFGDHALNSKQTSTKTAASVPPVSTTSRPSHTVALSPSGSGAGSSPSATPSSEASNPTGSTSVTDTSASTSSTVAPGTVLGTYVGIQLASGYSVNFLADPYHPAAGTSDGPDTMGFFAGSFVDGRFYADRVAILDATDTGSFTSCLNDTRYQRDVLLSQISTGASFCVTTGTGHLVLVTVRRLPSSTDANPYAVLDVTVWQGG